MARMDNIERPGPTAARADRQPGKGRRAPWGLGALADFFKTGADQPLLADAEEIKRLYRRGRISVFLSITLGYALYYVVRQGFAVVKKPLLDGGLPLVVNGCCGNVHPRNPIAPSETRSYREMGQILAADAERILKRLTPVEGPLRRAVRRLTIPLRDLDVGQCERASEHVCQVAGCGELVDRFGVAMDGCVEVAGGPVGEREQSCRAAASQVVVRFDELEGVHGVCAGAVEVAREQREASTLDEELGGEVFEHVRVEHDRRQVCAVHRLLHQLEQWFDASRVSGGHPRPDETHREYRSVGEEFVGQRFEPPSERRLLSALTHRRGGEFDQACCFVRVVSGHSVIDRFGRLPVC